MSTTYNSNPEMDRAMKMLRKLMRSSTIPYYIRMELRDLYQKFEDAQITYEEMLEEMRVQSYRNPDFSNDYVGWLDDDFDELDD